MDQSKIITIIDEHENVSMVPDTQADLDEDTFLAKDDTDTTVNTVKGSDQSGKAKAVTTLLPIGTNLPASKIRRLLKEYDEISIIPKDSLFLVTAATELFIQYYVSRAFELGKGKRKTVLYNDLIQLAKQDERFMFVSSIGLSLLILDEIDDPEFTGLGSSQQTPASVTGTKPVDIEEIGGPMDH